MKPKSRALTIVDGLKPTTVLFDAFLKENKADIIENGYDLNNLSHYNVAYSIGGILSGSEEEYHKRNKEHGFNTHIGVAALAWMWSQYKQEYILATELIESLNPEHYDMHMDIDKTVFENAPYPAFAIQWFNNEVILCNIVSDPGNTQVLLWLFEKPCNGGINQSHAVYSPDGHIKSSDGSDVSKYFDPHMPKDLDPNWNWIKNVVLYICSKNAEISNPVRVVKKGSQRVNGKRIRSSANISFVGKEYARQQKAYRYAVENGSGYETGVTVKPHMRRAHWHRFWTGKMDGERKQIVKWIPPVAVNGSSELVAINKVGAL